MHILLGVSSTVLLAIITPPPFLSHLSTQGKVCGSLLLFILINLWERLDWETVTGPTPPTGDSSFPVQLSSNYNTETVINMRGREAFI